MGFDNPSSGSDDDNNVRHDRFKSERFQNQKAQSQEQKDDKYSKRNDFRGSRHRERSPRGNRRRETTYPSSSYRTHSKYDSRNDHDRKERDKKSYSRSSKSDRNGSKSSECLEKVDSEVKPKKNLSSILKSFDRQVESKRNTLEESGPPRQEVGPVLPPHLKQKDESIKDSDQEKHSVESSNDTDLPVSKSVFEVDCTKANEDLKTYEVQLPPHLKKSMEGESDGESTCFSVEDSVLPPQVQISVECVDNSASDQETSSTKNVENHSFGEPTPDNSESCLPAISEPETYGPALPPKVNASAYGPALPPKMQHGPSLPPDLESKVKSDLEMEVEPVDESDDEDMVGPLPEGKMNMTQFQLDIRAASIKRQLEEEKNGSSKDVKKREEWMLELPPEKASNLGLGPRSFRKRDAPDMSNRSDWTDTPADRQRKAELAQSGIVVEPVNSEEAMKSAFVKERNEVMDKITKKSKEEDRPKSLLELHQKKLKKKKKKDDKEGKKKERRPFDRNIDLQVNRFDDAQKKAIFKKAQLLDSRFSTGESKYL